MCRVCETVIGTASWNGTACASSGTRYREATFATKLHSGGPAVTAHAAQSSTDGDMMDGTREVITFCRCGLYGNLIAVHENRGRVPSFASREVRRERLQTVT